MLTMEFTKRFYLFVWTKSWTLRQLNLLFRQEGSLLKTKGRQNKIMTSFKRNKASCCSECIMLGMVFFFFQINLYLKCYISKKFHIGFRSNRGLHWFLKQLEKLWKNSYSIVLLQELHFRQITPNCSLVANSCLSLWQPHGP